MEKVKTEVIEILRQQLQLLSEKSKEQDVSLDDLRRMSSEMDRIAGTILRAILD